MVTESEAAATYAALRAAAAAAEAVLNASARANKEPAAAEAVAAAARATAVEARVADAQAATAAMCTHACHAFFDSPHFNLLDARGSLRLVTDAPVSYFLGHNVTKSDTIWVRPRGRQLWRV